MGKFELSENACADIASVTGIVPSAHHACLMRIEKAAA